MSRSRSGGTGNSAACVVIAVVGGCLGILLLFVMLGSALLFPVFARAREKARQASCVSNEKYQALALLLYAADYDQHFPRSDKSDYQAIIQPYLRLPPRTSSTGVVFTCPADRQAPSYSFNVKLSRLPLAKLKQPNCTVMIFEGTEWSRPDTPHLRSTNLAFADGSCRTIGENLIAGQIWSPLQPAQP